MTSNKAFKWGSSLCSSSRPYFTWRDHMRRFVAATCRSDVSQRFLASCVLASKWGSSFCSLTSLNLHYKDPIDFASEFTTNKAFKQGPHFVVWPCLIYKMRTPLISCQLTTNNAFKRGSSFCSSSWPYSTCHDHTRRFVAATCRGDVCSNLWYLVSWPLSQGLSFVVRPSLIYKTKTPLISHQLTTSTTFKRGSSFCSLTRLNLQNEDPIDFASVDNEQSI